jgi:UDP-2,4-diacetamido-2,4,6-trideoxy-beta-L-altropyranose hydrolase
MSGLRIVFRTDAGVKIGFGHVRRCMTLGRALAHLGADVRFLCNGPPVIQELILARGFPSETVDGNSDLEQTTKMLGEHKAHMVIVDSYDLREDYLAGLRSGGWSVVAIDDLATHPFPVDLVVNGAANASELHYSALSHTQFLLGPRHILLREEYGEALDRQAGQSVRTVLVLLGGSDPCSLTGKLIRWIRKALPNAAIDAVIGPLFENPYAVEQISQQVGNVRLHVMPKRLRELMTRADLAVSGGGQTCYELAATGTPTLAVCTAENQRGNLSGLSRGGTLLVVGDADDPELETKLLGRLTKLADDPDCRQTMSLRGRQLVDGQGARRVAAAITSMAASVCAQIQ